MLQNPFVGLLQKSASRLSARRLRRASVRRGHASARPRRWSAPPLVTAPLVTARHGAAPSSRRGSAPRRGLSNPGLLRQGVGLASPVNPIIGYKQQQCRARRRSRRSRAGAQLYGGRDRRSRCGSAANMAVVGVRRSAGDQDTATAKSGQKSDSESRSLRTAGLAQPAGPRQSPGPAGARRGTPTITLCRAEGSVDDSDGEPVRTRTGSLSRPRSTHGS
jgi:hypothetical protein